MNNRPNGIIYKPLISEDKEVEEKQTNPSSKLTLYQMLAAISFYKLSIYIPSIFDSVLYAGYDASGIVMGLEDMEDMSDDTLSKYLGIPIEHLKVVVPLIFAVYSFTLNYPSLISGINISIEDFKSLYRGEPLEFIPKGYCETYSCCLSRKSKIILSLGTIVFIGGFAAAADGICGDYFIASVKGDAVYLSEIPTVVWKAISVYCSYVVAKMTFFTETPEIKKFFFRYLTEEIEETSKLRPLLKNLAHYSGNLFRIIGGIEVAIEIYVALVALMNAHSTEFRFILFALSFIRSTSDFFFTGQKGLDAINALFVKLSEGVPSTKEIILFLMTVLPILLVVDAQRELFRAFLTEPDTALPFDSPPMINELIADGTAIREGIVQSYTLYPLVLWLADNFLALAKTAFCCGRAKKEYLEDESDEEEVKEERIKLLDDTDDQSTENADNSADEKSEYVPPSFTASPVYSTQNQNLLFTPRSQSPAQNQAQSSKSPFQICIIS